MASSTPQPSKSAVPQRAGLRQAASVGRTPPNEGSWLVRGAVILVIFAILGGGVWGAAQLMGKQSNYEHSVRVPLMMAGPGIPAGPQSRWGAGSHMRSSISPAARKADGPSFRTGTPGSS